MTDKVLRFPSWGIIIVDVEFERSRVETLPLRRDQLIAVSVALVFGIIVGLVVGYFKPLKLGEVIDASFSIAFAVLGAGLGGCSIFLNNAKGIVAWMPWGMMGIMGSFGLQPFATFPVVLFASWAASFAVICSYHFLMNGVHNRKA